MRLCYLIFVIKPSLTLTNITIVYFNFQFQSFSWVMKWNEIYANIYSSIQLREAQVT